MNRFSFFFWFFYSARTAVGVLFHMGAHQYVYFDSIITFFFAAWLSTKLFLLKHGPVESNSVRPVGYWILLYLGWSFITLLWTPAPVLLAGGKLLKISLEAGIVLALITFGDIREVTSYSIAGFLYGAILAAALYGFYPYDEERRVGVEGGIEGHDIALVIGLAGVIAFVQWVHDPDRWHTVQATVLAIGTMILMYKSCVIAYGMAVTPIAFRSGTKRFAKALVALGLMAWIVFPWVAPYLVPYIEAEGYLTLTGRIFIWANAWEYIVARPLVGSGYDSAKVLLSDLGEFSPGHAHNIWIQNWMCLGLIGVVLMLAAFGSFTKIAWQHRKLHVGQVAIALIIFGFVRGMTDPASDLCPPIGLMLLFTAAMRASLLSPEKDRIAVSEYSDHPSGSAL